jgi:Endonuclease NucS
MRARASGVRYAICPSFTFGSSSSHGMSVGANLHFARLRDRQRHKAVPDRQRKAVALAGSALAIEKSLQSLIERNLDAMLGVRFVATEHATGKVHGGRIDTLGLDENGSPVIVEYKRSSNENVINQGLFYLDWLLDHRVEFTLLAMKTLGSDVEDTIDWSAPRLVCVAGDFTSTTGTRSPRSAGTSSSIGIATTTGTSSSSSSTEQRSTRRRVNPASRRSAIELSASTSRRRPLSFERCTSCSTLFSSRSGTT